MNFPRFILLAAALGAWPFAAWPQSSGPVAPPRPPPVVEVPQQLGARALAGAAAPEVTPLTTTLYSCGDATGEEQLYLELINRARGTPAAEGVRFSTSNDPNVQAALSFFGVNVPLMLTEFAALPARAPLAMNARLLQAARAHTQDMLANVFQDHVGSNGSTPEVRVANAGYSISALAENVYANAESSFHGHAGFQVDWGHDDPDDGDGMQGGRGHRMNIHGSFREAGIGVAVGSNAAGGNEVGPQLVAQDFATQNPDANAFVTGVAFYDLNGNSFYDAGEGIGGVTVNVEGASFHAVTNNAGGYAVPVPATPAEREVTFSGLGFLTISTASIADGRNVKTDLAPVYQPPTITGPGTVDVLEPTGYTFSEVPGATSYEWRRASLAPAATDGAENLSRVTVTTSGGYPIISSTVKHAGSGSYHLAQPAGDTEVLACNATLLVGANASLSFRSRLGTATATQTAKVQVSADDGATWSDVFSQNGSGNPGETAFNLRTAPLNAFAGREIRLRFVYAVLSGSFFPQTSDGVGWYIDDIAFVNVRELTSPAITAVEEGSAFQFAAAAAGDSLLAVRPVISGRAFPFGPSIEVTAAVNLNAPDIAVQQPAGNHLVNGSGAVSFGSVTLGENAQREVIISNQGSDPLTGISVAIEGIHAADFSTGELTATTLNASQSTVITATFAPSAAGARSATLRLTSNDPDENPFTVALTGTGDANFRIVTQPASAVVQAGSEVTFSASALPLPSSYQWRKNGAAVKNATQSSFTIPQARLTDAGLYSVVASQSGTALTSNAVSLGVVENLPKLVAIASGLTATLTVNASGTGLTFQWKRGDEMLAADPRNPKRLVIKGVTVASSGIYTCTVTGPGGSAVGGTCDLRVFSTKPDVIDEQNMPDGIVGGSYTHAIAVLAGAAVFPTSFAASNLPPGLKVDPKTGVITGKPTKPGTYLVKVTATNSKGSDFATDSIFIAGLPAHLAGIYAGPVGRAAGINGNLGGRIELTIGSTGSFTGQLLLGAARHPFSGVMDVDAAGQLQPSAAVTIKRTGALPPLALQFEVSPALFNSRIENGTVTDGAATATFNGWRHIWNLTNRLAAPSPKLYTFGLAVDVDSAAVPLGSGFGSFTVGKDGKLTLAGKTADGESITGGAFAGPHGEIVCFQLLYTTNPKGSLLGVLDLDAGDTGSLDSGALNGSLTWLRPPNPASTARLYKAGFGPVAVTAFGSRYVSPAAPNLILGLAEPVAGGNAQILFADGGYPEEIAGLAFSVKARNQLQLPPAGPLTNPAAVTLAVVPATGRFSGGFKLVSPDPRNAFAGKNVTRTATFTGVLTNDGTGPVGAGFFLLPELPRDADAQAVPPQPATTPTTSRILSGSVTLRKAP